MASNGLAVSAHSTGKQDTSHHRAGVYNLVVVIAETVAKPEFLFGLMFYHSRSAASGQVCYVHAWNGLCVY